MRYPAMPACMLLCGTIAACSWSEGTSARDGGTKLYPVPTHVGFNQRDSYGAVRISYLDDPTMGVDFNGRYVVYASRKGWLYLIDLDSQKETRTYPGQITNMATLDGFMNQPVILQSNIIARGYEGEPIVVKLYTFTIPEGKKQVLEMPYDSPRYLDADDNTLVWNDMRHWDEDGGHNLEVYMYDFTRQEERRLTRQPLQQFYPKVSGRYIVWEDYSKGYYREEMVLYDLITGIQKDLTSDLTRQIAPDIDGDLVVWTDLRNGIVYPNGTYENADVYMYRISTAEYTRLTNEEHDQEYPLISGKWVAWTDLRFGKRGPSNVPDTTNVFVHNLETGEEKQVTFGQGDMEHPQCIHGNRLVYHGYATGGLGSLWLVDLERYWPQRGAGR